jgi:hypothetical protein
MGWRITKGKTKGCYNVYCSIVDKYLGRNVPRQEVIEAYVKRQEERASWEIERWLKEVDDGIRPYKT